MATPRTVFGHPVAGLLSLLAIYVIWGSTYLGIRLAVRPGAGWPPFWLGATRVFVASAILLGICALRRVRVRPTRAELVVIAGSGVLMWVGGNGAVNWAEQRIDSGLAALVVGAMPMWVVLMECVIERRLPSTGLVVSLLVGFAGLGVLTMPMWNNGLQGDLAGVLAVITAAVCWGAGTVWLNRRPVGVDSVALAGLQQIFGGIGFIAMIAIFAEPLPDPSPEAWAAWWYLMLFGSVIAFTCFIHAVKTLPVSLVSTYTYVNPVIAVLLGWLLIDEPVTASTLAGAILIIGGVYGVFREKTTGADVEGPGEAAPSVKG